MLKRARFSSILWGVIVVGIFPIAALGQNRPPVAVAGDPYISVYDFKLDGHGSYDPDGDSLKFKWRQISGPSATLESNTAATTEIWDIEQTDEIQRLTFELVVSDGQLSSQPDAVEVVVIAAVDNDYTLRHTGFYPFNPDKPTIIAFGSGNCRETYGLFRFETSWSDKVNWFTARAKPPYYRYADYLIAHLLDRAPNYQQPIQTIGFSTGGMPAIDVAKRLNLDYGDPRYAVNRVTLLDAACRPENANIEALIHQDIQGETCWIDLYIQRYSSPDSINQPYGTLPVILTVTDEDIPVPPHTWPWKWYEESIESQYWLNGFYNEGITGGFYLSVAGPAKNLYIPPDANSYIFESDRTGRHLHLYDEGIYPGRIPEPITLLGPTMPVDSNNTGILLTCQESANVDTYELLVGPDPYRIQDYQSVYQGSEVPALVMNALPFTPIWGTVKGHNAYGAKIHADPVRLDGRSWRVENATAGYRYSSIQDAINHAQSGDEIILMSGTYTEDLQCLDKNVTLRSVNPADPGTVANTVLETHATPVCTLIDGVTVRQLP
ncbi:hypothetical protein ACFL6U_02215 [Planctomycetota bacterium]